MGHNREERQADVTNTYDFVVFGGEYSIFNAALIGLDVIITGGNVSASYLQSEMRQFGIDLATEMARSIPPVNPITERLYVDKFIFENWETVLGVKIPLPNKFVPYVAARKKKPPKRPAFLLQTGTALHETDASFDFCLAPNQDLFVIKKSGTGTGTTEVHVLSADSNYQKFILQTGTALHETDSTWAFGVASNRDVVGIKKSGTGTGTTEVHVLSAASNYASFSLHTGTALHPTDDTWAFAIADNRDVFGIKKSGTGTGTTEVHVLSAASNYTSFSLHTGTALHLTDDTWAFAIADNRDVFGIKKSGTGTDTTEVHVLSAAGNYASFSLQTGTALHPTDNTWAFAVTPARDLFGVKKSNTGSRSTEVHIVNL